MQTSFNDLIFKAKNRLTLPFVRKILPLAVGHCCIALSEKDFVLAYANDIKSATQLHLQAHEIHSYNDENELYQKLTAARQRLQIHQVATTLLLSTHDYQTLFADALPVTQAEFQAAIRWKIKGLIRFSVEEALIDHFAIAPTKSGQNKILVVAAALQKMQLLKQKLDDIGFKVNAITIPALGLCGVANLYARADETIIFVYALEHATELLILQNAEIYITRELKFGFDPADSNILKQNIERLAAELQRSLGYYQSQWQKSGPVKFLFSTPENLSEEIMQVFAQEIKTPVEIINLNEKIITQKFITATEQSKLIPAVGTLLQSKFPLKQNINLYQYFPKLPKQYLTITNVVGAYSALVFILLMLLINQWWQKHLLFKQWQQVTQEVQTAQTTLTSFVNKFSELDIATLEKTIGTLQNDYENKLRLSYSLTFNKNFSNYLIALGNAIVADVWLTEITFNRINQQIELKGHVLQTAFVKQFFSQLQQQPAFKDLVFEINEIKQEHYPNQFIISAAAENK